MAKSASSRVRGAELERRIAETYAARSTATLKNSLYNTYKMTIRWASDRIGDQGAIAFVTSGSWIDRNVDSGVRACLAEEFSAVYVLNLRGDQRTQGERSRREGGKVFGQDSREPVAITVLVRNPDAAQEGCHILYRDVGDYLSREEKLARLRDWGSVAGIHDWQAITPDRHHDWIGQRDEAFARLYPLGSKAAKAGRNDDAVFRLFSNGYKTSRDAYIYNFSWYACAENARMMVDDYLGALAVREEHSEYTVDDAAKHHSSHLRWDQALKDNLDRRKRVTYSPARIWKTQYRPFVKQYCYVDYVLVNRKYQQDRIFPSPDTDNRAICVPGVGSTKPFSVLMVDAMPDLHFAAFGQCFPRYRFEQRENAAGAQRDLLDAAAGLARIDNVTDTALHAFRVHYNDNTITKDAIFDYVYGILHAPAYRERFANDLTKELPRVPFAPEFQAFAAAGNRLAELHLDYENGEEWPLEVVFAQPGEPAPEHCRIGERAMRFADDDRSVLIVDDHLRLAGIPAQAHDYQVNGRTPIEWFVDRYRITRDKDSGILNDPNGWFEDPRDLIAAFRRIVQVSVETMAVVESLPCPFSEPEARPNGERP